MESFILSVKLLSEHIGLNNEITVSKVKVRKKIAMIHRGRKIGGGGGRNKDSLWHEEPSEEVEIPRYEETITAWNLSVKKLQ